MTSLKGLLRRVTQPRLSATSLAADSDIIHHSDIHRMTGTTRMTATSLAIPLSPAQEEGRESDNTVNTFEIGKPDPDNVQQTLHVEWDPHTGTVMRFR